MTKVLVVGYGSIGRRHADILQKIGCEVAVVTRQPVNDYPVFSQIKDGLANVRPEYVVIAVETGRHVEMIEVLSKLGFGGKVMVEKPLAGRKYSPPSKVFSRLAVAYNLRFHPVLLALRAKLQGLKILAVDVRAGQHLSEWREGRDFRQSYSASRDLGGGVIRDLSHELDYLLWLFE